MSKKKPQEKPLPKVEARPENGRVYLTCNTRITPDEFMTHEAMRKKFFDYYNEDPETVFYGPPNGSLIYAGPVPGLDTEFINSMDGNNGYDY